MCESRPLDFLYDSVCTLPTAKNYCQLLADAVQKTSEKDIRPCYDSMFSDVHRYPKLQLVYRTEKIPSFWEAKSETLKRNETVLGRNLVKYVCSVVPDTMTSLRPDKMYNASAHKVNIDGIEHVMKTDGGKSEPVTKRKSVCTKGTQTDYRDSETQTSLWIPPYTIVNGVKTLDLFSTQIESEIPAAYDVDLFEDKRKIDELERELLTTSKRNLRAQIAITRKIEKIEWIVKEKQIDHVNEVRMEYAETLFYKHTLEARMNISKREESFVKMQEKLSNQKLQCLIKRRERDKKTRTKVWNKKINISTNRILTDRKCKEDLNSCGYLLLKENFCQKDLRMLNSIKNCKLHTKIIDRLNSVT